MHKRSREHVERRVTMTASYWREVWIAIDQYLATNPVLDELARARLQLAADKISDQIPRS